MARSAVTSRTLERASASVGLEGVADVKKKLEERIDRFSALGAKKVFMRAGMILVREERDAVMHLTPDSEATGQLAAAIFASYGDPKKPNVVVGVRSGGGKKKSDKARAPHAYPVAHGHGGPHPAPPHPWVSQSVNATKGVMAVTIAEGLKDLVEQP